MLWYHHAAVILTLEAAVVPPVGQCYHCVNELWFQCTAPRKALHESVCVSQGIQQSLFEQNRHSCYTLYHISTSRPVLHLCTPTAKRPFNLKTQELLPFPLLCLLLINITTIYVSKCVYILF